MYGDTFCNFFMLLTLWFVCLSFLGFSYALVFQPLLTSRPLTRKVYGDSDFFLIVIISRRLVFFLGLVTGAATSCLGCGESPCCMSPSFCFYYYSTILTGSGYTKLLVTGGDIFLRFLINLLYFLKKSVRSVLKWLEKKPAAICLRVACFLWWIKKSLAASLGISIA